jgi:YD repeat-containing protein
MKRSSQLCVLLIVLGGPLYAVEQEIVAVKTLSAYEGKSYLYKTEVRLVTGFVINSNVQGEFYIRYENVVNQPLSPDKNFIRTEMILKRGITQENNISALTSDKKRTTYRYSDGLGRFLQEASLEESPTKADVVKFSVYDSYGRESREYLPITIVHNMGAYQEDAVTRQNVFYNGSAVQRPYGTPSDAEPFHVKVFDNSPADNIRQAYGPGLDWHIHHGNRPKKSTTRVIASNEVRLWTYEGTGMPQSPGYYPANLLMVTETVDEEGFVQKRYTDFKQRLVLEQKGDGMVWFDTYFVYDQADRLVFTFPPEAVKRIFQTNSEYIGKTAAQQQTFADTWAFQYRYDEFGRLAEKRSPGAGWVFTIYDAWDRVALTQDAVQRQSNQWSYIKYDVHNRKIITGTTTGTRTTLQNLARNSTVRYEIPANNAIGYTNTSFPVHTEPGILTINYYDSYTFLSNAGWDAESLSYTFVPENGFETTRFASVKGYSTGTKTKILGTSKWLNAVTYYNPAYQVVQTITENHLGGTDRISKLFEFDGSELMAKHVHNSPSGNTTILEEYTYDHAKRLIGITHQLNNGPKILMVANR